jgi:serine protease Do
MSCVDSLRPDTDASDDRWHPKYGRGDARANLFRRWALTALIVLVAGGSDPIASQAAEQRVLSTADLVAKVLPTVVNITAHRVSVPAARAESAGFTGVRQSVGSGFVVDPSGFIVTNNHVIEGAYEITVTFADGRTVPAKRAGESTCVDVAFLQVDVGKPIPAVTLAAGNGLRIGDRVFAIGNPLGLGTSVSAGIVSALDRNIKESPYDDFIQTDAAINHGNSGGPLFNEAGEVVGINTALFSSSTSGGSEGLGFAIPGRDVTFLIDQVKHYGHVRAGWLGVNTQKLTPELSQGLKYPGTYGAIVATVVPDSPAALAGIQSGDVVQTFEDEPVYDVTTLNRAAAMALGKTVKLGIWRESGVISVSATLTEDKRSHYAAGGDSDIAAPHFANTEDLGLELAPMSDDLAKRFKLPAGQQGLVVTGVAADSAAYEAGLRTGNVIVTIKRIPVKTVDAIEQVIADEASAGRGRVIAFVQASGGERWIALPIRM